MPRTKRARQAGDTAISYLEALDDEHWQLSGQEPPKVSRDLREAFVKAGRPNSETPNEAESAFRHDLLSRLHAARRAGLCFSGGGIRSATFGLGILQGLARQSRDDGTGRPQLLGEFDYLSTVSGGGYLGSWFSAWATRRARPSERTFRAPGVDAIDGPAAVIQALARTPEVGLDPEPPEVKGLRSYSNYLTPRVGLSADTLAVAATVLRNILLNWLVLIPLFAATLLIPVVAERILAGGLGGSVQRIFLTAGFIFGAAATGYIGFDLPSAGNAKQDSRRYLWFGFLPILVAAVLLNTYWAWTWRSMTPDANAFSIWSLMGFGALMHGGGMLVGILLAMLTLKHPAPITGLYATAAAVVTGAIAGAAAFVVARMIGPIDVTTVASTIKYTCIAFPLTMGIFLFAGTLLVGVSSYFTEDKDREWWSRAGGWLVAITLGWLLFAPLILYANQILDGFRAIAASALAALTGLGAAKLGGSGQTPSGRGEEGAGVDWLSVPGLMQFAIRLALPIFLVLLILLLAFMNHQLLDWTNSWINFSWAFDWNASFGRAIAFAGPAVLLMAAYLLIGLLSSLFINVNTFSLHAMYKQRLVRAYLGASNSKRDPNLFTGFDENDNMAMCALTTHKPLHIVNMALNLVAGKNLAWQQRKAQSFTSTRLHTGGSRVGYRSSAEYGGKYTSPARNRAISLGTAITVSGAAASPNMGYNSSPLLTVVMTLFNARLGWWLGNPAGDRTAWKLSGPRFGVRPFLDEMFGRTDDESTWVYLSDGGHFENLGLYELVLRRCAVIVVSDSGADHKCEYSDLGNAVRKIRVDLGISIDFDAKMPMSPTGVPTPDASGHHCAIGRIRYSDHDNGAEDGLLLYLKPFLSGDEPVDVQHYASENDTFPHQSTSDQFFDEAQFESYRRLGLHIVERICRDDQPGRERRSDGLDLRQFVERVKSYVAAPTP